MDYCSDLSFVNYGYAENSSASACGRRFEGYYGTQFLYHGRMYAHTGDHPEEFADGPCVFVTFPGVPFYYGAPAGQVRSQAHICFRGERAVRYCDEGLLTLRETALFRRLADPDAFFHTMQRLFQLLKVPGSVPHARAVLLLEELLLQIQEQPVVPDKIYTRYMDDLLALRDRIAMDPLLPWNFQKEARKMDLSYVHFRRIFKQTTSWPPGGFLLECRLRQAEKLLMSTHARVSEIAQTCGFNDAYHFSRIFKKHCGHSPAEFRKLYGNR